MKRVLCFIALIGTLFGFEYADCCGMIADVHIHQKEIPKPPVKTADTRIEYYALNDEIAEPTLEIAKNTKDMDTKE